MDGSADEEGAPDSLLDLSEVDARDLLARIATKPLEERAELIEALVRRLEGELESTRLGPSPEATE
ncbi:MAG: hypothetical protein M3164_01705 [Actinomycetota bacterium]|nr:hypothetical protein [Actinomycetota bacterium]